MRKIIAAFSCSALLACSTLPALAAPGGGVRVAVEDITNHDCIDVSKNDVSIQTFALQAKRTRTFWSTSKLLGGKFDVILTNADGKPVTFPRGIQITAKDIHGDVAMLPVTYPVISMYALQETRKDPAGKETPAYFKNIELDFYVINIEGTSSAAKNLFQLIDFAKSLPVPPNPYTQGINAFGDFAKKVVDLNVNSTEEKQPVAVYSFDLASTAAQARACPATGLREGINLILFEPTGSGDGYIPIADVGKNCYWANAATSQIEYRPRIAGKCAANGPAKTVLNPLVALLVAKWVKADAVAALAVPNVNTASTATFMKAPAISNDAITRLMAGEKGKFHPGVDSGSVKSLTDIFNGRNGLVQFKNAIAPAGAPTISAAKAAQAQTAINIRNCALLGIKAENCK